MKAQNNTPVQTQTNPQHLPPVTDPVLRDLNTRQETADYLRVPYLTLQFWASTREGRAKLPYSKYGRSVMYRKKDVLTLINSSMKGIPSHV